MRACRSCSTIYVILLRLGQLTEVGTDLGPSLISWAIPDSAWLASTYIRGQRRNRKRWKRYDKMLRAPLKIAQ